ncbi:MAG: SPOR domain-containing protein [Synergistaceae bacterium]|nr:SPOR domain-containing protein [Synergistaceae bacterium]
MVTRRTRNYKEKRPMTTFGQFILPLTVVMAIALLFLSVKLFFMDPNDAYLEDGKSNTAAHSVTPNKPKEIKKDTPKIKDEKASPVPVVKKAEQKKTMDVVMAKPVDVSKNGPKTPRVIKQDTSTPKQEKKASQTPITSPAPKKGTSVQPTVKKREAAAVDAAAKKTEDKREKQTADKMAKQPQLRWDVQIGSFVSKESAEALLKKAVSQGYKAYMNESAHTDKTTYKVRVKGSDVKSESSALAAKLQTEGYPTYLIQTK